MHRNETDLHAWNTFAMVETKNENKKRNAPTTCTPSTAQLEKEKMIHIFASTCASASVRLKTGRDLSDRSLNLKRVKMDFGTRQRQKPDFPITGHG